MGSDGNKGLAYISIIHARTSQPATYVRVNKGTAFCNITGWGFVSVATPHGCSYGTVANASVGSDRTTQKHVLLYEQHT